VYIIDALYFRQGSPLFDPNCLAFSPSHEFALTAMYVFVIVSPYSSLNISHMSNQFRPSIVNNSTTNPSHSTHPNTHNTAYNYTLHSALPAPHNSHSPAIPPNSHSRRYPRPTYHLVSSPPPSFSHPAYLVLTIRATVKHTFADVAAGLAAAANNIGAVCAAPLVVVARVELGRNLRRVGGAGGVGVVVYFYAGGEDLGGEGEGEGEGEEGGGWHDEGLASVFDCWVGLG
jgi:hypothetical protein